MPINFPNSPILNEQYTYDNKTWEWNGTYWEVYSALTSYITSAYTVGDGVSDISGVTGGNIALKSFSGVNITIVDGGDKLTFSGYPQQNVVGFYLPLSGGTVTGGTIFQSGLTANTISATTYYNLPISGVTDGTGISTSITDGNVTITNTAPDLTVTITGGTNIEITGTYPDFGVNYTGISQNLIASNSCAITPNNRVYVGNSNYGWGYGLWDLEYPSLSEQYSNVSIPINKTILSGESIDVCGKAYVNDFDGQTCTLHFYLYTHNCDITTITELARHSDSFDKDGLFCFSYRVPIESNLSECDNFLVLGFRATTNDATVCKITYTINSKHSI